MLAPLIWLLMAVVYAFFVAIAKTRASYRSNIFWFCLCLTMFVLAEVDEFHRIEKRAEEQKVEWTRFR